ncbi:hypothetical protein FRC12_021093 [Ceratobasidium sp. 428]|nr:hypothetical protein FRC12_021093 [Ceratobasidium sp. 428]
MSELIKDKNPPRSGTDLPDLAADLGPTTLPSAKSYASWAESARKVFAEDIVLGKVALMPARVCPFCASVVRCPTSIQSLIEHMRSSACRAEQQDLEAEILGAVAKPKPQSKQSKPPRNSATQVTQNAPDYSSRVLLGAQPGPLQCPGAKFTSPKSLWSRFPWHLLDRTRTDITPLSFYICGVMNREGDRVLVRSHACSGVISKPGSSSCEACSETIRSQEFLQIIRRAMADTPEPGLDPKYYSYRQLADLVAAKEETLKRYRLKVRTASFEFMAGYPELIIATHVFAPAQELEVSRKARRLL